MPTTKYISPDTPQWFQSSPSTQLNPPSKAYLKLTTPQLFRGTHLLNSGNTTNPVTLQPLKVPKLTRHDSLRMEIKSHPAVLKSDANSFTARHTLSLQTSSKSFVKLKGTLETYLEDAHLYRDFLVYLPAQERGGTSSNNTRKVKEKNDYYDLNDGVSVTSGWSNSVGLKDRHHRSEAAKSPDNVKNFSRDRRQMFRPRTTHFTLMQQKRNQTLNNLERSNATKSIKSYETHHHSTLDLTSLTKLELIDILEVESIPIPGKLEFDKDTGECKREGLKKKEYLDYVNKQLYSKETEPVFETTHKLGDSSSTISIYKSLKGGIRVKAIDCETSRELQLFLTAAKLEDLDVAPVPDNVPVVDNGLVFKDFSKTTEEIKRDEELAESVRQKTEYDAWSVFSSVLIERLRLSIHGDLEVAAPTILENGLSFNFCLTGRGGGSLEEKRGREASRVHVTAWFNT